MTEEFNVLSLFDGMSCGLQALKNIGIHPTNYFASEIDRYAMTIARKNHPEIIHIGDVTKQVVENGGLLVNGKTYKIHLIIGGSPCQGFSFAGKQLNFNDPRSKLFFEFVRLRNELQPDYFLLENVKMKQVFQDVINEYIGLEPVVINSALVSAQNRIRLYWTDIPGITQPEDLGVTLMDVLENDGFAGARIVGRRINALGKRADYDLSIPPIQRLEINENPMKTNCLTTVQKDNVIVMSINDPAIKVVPEGAVEANGRLIFLAGLTKGLRLKDGKYYSRNYREGSRIYSIKGLAATLTAASKGGEGGEGGYSGLYGIVDDGLIYYRNLSPLECERLQTLPDQYTEGVSDTQRYKMLGNGWTVKVIEHILKGLLLQPKRIQQI